MQEQELVSPISNLPAERELLGACLGWPRYVADADFLIAADFQDPLHAAAWGEMLRARAEGEQGLDFSTLAHRLWKRGGFPAIGDQTALTLRLHSWVTSTGAVEGLARVVKETAVARRLSLLCSDVVAKAHHPGFDAKDALEGLRGDLARVDAWGDRETPDAASFMGPVMDEIESRTQGVVQAVKTGIGSYDRKIGGWRPGQLIVVAARPGQGKSALAKTIALNLAKDGTPVWMWSLEMTRTEVVERMLASEARVSSHLISMGQMNGHAQSVYSAGVKLSRLPIYIEDQNLSNEAAIARVRRWHAHPDVGDRLGLVVVDYLGLILPKRGRDRTKTEAVGEIALTWKHLAVEIGKPIMLVCQLNRDSEKQNRDPVLSDLRDSGEIEQHANIVIFPSPGKVDGEASLIVAKNRGGPTGRVAVEWRPEFTEFSDTSSSINDWQERYNG